MPSTKALSTSVFIICILGLSICSYAYYVELSHLNNKDYKAYCDVNEWMSCSKVFSSKYGTGFGLLSHILGESHPLVQPNSVYGIAFYILQILCGLFRRQRYAGILAIILSICSNCMFLYLAYILFFVLHDFCVLCVITYILNIALLIINVTLNSRRGVRQPVRETPSAKRKSKKDK